MKIIKQLAHFGWPIAWVLWMATSLGGAFLFLSGEARQWLGFIVTIGLAGIFAVHSLRQAFWQLTNFRSTVESPLWTAAARAIHDMGTPLHVLRFCLQQLKENPTVATTPGFLEQMHRSSDRTLETYDHLRNYTRAVRDEEGPVSFRLAYEQALRVVRSRFPDHPCLKSLEATQTPEDLVQIGAGPLIRALSVLLARCLNTPGNITVAVNSGTKQLRVAISGAADGPCSPDLETQSIQHLVGNWDGELKPMHFPDDGSFGYTLQLERDMQT